MTRALSTELRTGEDTNGIGSGFTVTFQIMLQGPGSCQSPPTMMGLRELEQRSKKTCPHYRTAYLPSSLITFHALITIATTKQFPGNSGPAMGSTVYEGISLGGKGILQKYEKQLPGKSTRENTIVPLQLQTGCICRNKEKTKPPEISNLKTSHPKSCDSLEFAHTVVNTVKKG